MKNYLAPLIEQLRGRPAGPTGAGVFFCLALLWVIFGFWKMLFIVVMTLAGYLIGTTFFQSREQFRRWLDRLFPPGNVR